MNFLNLNKKEVTMTSLEVSNIIQINHYQVMKGIRREIEQLKNAGIRAEDKFILGSYKDKNNQDRPCYILNRKGVMQIGARYKAEIRHKLIDYIEKLSEMKADQQLNNTVMSQLENLIEDKFDEKIEKFSQFVRPSSRQKTSISRYIKKCLGIERTNEEYELIKQRVLIILGGEIWEDIPAETLASNMDVIDESIRIVKSDRKARQISMFI
ncbi:Rha family transcriptional regulator [Anaerophilus nitritogenes]|uniref:Rha family transcriptional regulator n=1 Tax=Anaerophilus nitritogenes TaxID=2498136 RepID=UPI0013EAEC19|nr:Rha family transcriptional regulator [Anaerophilus nitritogenes]